MNEQSHNPTADENHETACQLTEDALDACVKGDDEDDVTMIEGAKQTDSSILQQVIQDLDEDAGSDHSVPNHNRRCPFPRSLSLVRQLLGKQAIDEERAFQT